MRLTIVNTTEHDLVVNGIQIAAQQASEIVYLENMWTHIDEVPPMMMYYVLRLPQAVLTIT